MSFDFFPIHEHVSNTSIDASPADSTEELFMHKPPTLPLVSLQHGQMVVAMVPNHHR